VQAASRTQAAATAEQAIVLIDTVLIIGLLRFVAPGAGCLYHGIMTLDLTKDEKLALAALLTRPIEDDRYPFEARTLATCC
jgi:hypothetical protein